MDIPVNQDISLLVEWKMRWRDPVSMNNPIKLELNFILSSVIAINDSMIYPRNVGFIPYHGTEYPAIDLREIDKVWALAAMHPRSHQYESAGLNV